MGFGKRTSKALAVLTASLMVAFGLPATALAEVRIDDTVLNAGENAVGGGTAVLSDSSLSMKDVSAQSAWTDESLDVSFEGGNNIETFTVAGDAEVSMEFSGENEVEDIYAQDTSKLAVKADGHNDFEEVNASDKADVTIEVYGENEFESIEAKDDATITIVGKTCQMRDTIELAEDEESEGITTERGGLVIDHVTIEVEGKKVNIGSAEGNVKIDTSKIEGEDDNEHTVIFAGGEMEITESVIDIKGEIWSGGQMTIDHSDVSVEEPEEDAAPYRVFSYTGIELIDEENGKVLEGEIDGEDVWYVDTGDGDDVELEADGTPAYYKPCEQTATIMPSTGDGVSIFLFTLIALLALGMACLSGCRIFLLEGAGTPTRMRTDVLGKSGTGATNNASSRTDVRRLERSALEHLIGYCLFR